MRKVNSLIANSRASLLDEFGRRQSFQPTILKPPKALRVVNPNFIFFCQVLLLIIPIAVLYAGLYFLDVTSQTLVLVCGILIFALLFVVICVRPFSIAEPKGEDTVPLTHDMSPSAQRYGNETVDNTKPQNSCRPQDSAKGCPLLQTGGKDHPMVQDAVIEACSCPHNPAFQETDQSDEDQPSECSYSSLLTEKDSSDNSMVMYSSEESPKKNLWSSACAAGNSSKRSDSKSGKATASSNNTGKCGKRSCLEDSLNSDHTEKKRHMVPFDLRDSKLCITNASLKGISSDTSKSSALKITPCAGNAKQKPCAPVKQKPECRVSLCGTPKAKRVLFNEKDDELLGYQTPKCGARKVSVYAGTSTFDKQRHECRISACNISKAKRVLFKPSDETPPAEQTPDDEKEIQTSKDNATRTPVSPKTSELELPHAAGDRLTTIPCPTVDDKDKLPKVTIKLYPKSSKEGMFEWVRCHQSPSCNRKCGVGFKTVVYNMQALEAAEGCVSEITVNESSQTAISLNPNTLQQMMLSTIHENVTLSQDCGTQVEMPEMIPQPPSVMYVVNEKVPSRTGIGSKDQKSESDHLKPSDPLINSACDTKRLVDIVSTANEINQSQLIKQQDSVSGSNDSILDIVMKRPYSAKSKSPASNDEHSNLKSSDTPSLESKTNADIIDDNKPKDGVINRVMIYSTTPVSGSTGSTPSNRSSCDSGGLLKYNLSFLLPKDESRKIKGDDRAKVCSSNEECKVDSLSNEQSKEFFTALYMGIRDDKYQPKQLGLLATESSKEEMIPVKRKAGISPKIKKKTKVRHTGYLSDNVQQDGKIILSKYIPLHKKNERGQKSPYSNSKIRNLHSPIVKPQSPNIGCKSSGRYNQSPTEFHQGQMYKSRCTDRNQYISDRKDKSPIRNLESPSRHQHLPNGYKNSPTRQDRSSLPNQVPSYSYQRSPLRNEKSPSSHKRNQFRCQQSPRNYNTTLTTSHQSSTRNQRSVMKNEKSSNLREQYQDWYSRSPTGGQQPPNEHEVSHIRNYQPQTCKQVPVCEKQCSSVKNKRSPDCGEHTVVRSQRSPIRYQEPTGRNGKSPTKSRQSPTRKPVSTSREQHSPVSKLDISRTSSSAPRIQKEGKNDYNIRQVQGDLTDVKGRRFSFPPFNLDFSTGFNNVNQASVESWKNEQNAPPERKRRPAVEETKNGPVGNTKQTGARKCKSPEGSPTRNKSRRISHRVESTIFKKSSSSYENVIIERVLKQKKKTLKKFK